MTDICLSPTKNVNSRQNCWYPIYLVFSFIFILISCCFCYYFVQEQTVDQQPFMIKNPEKLTDKHYVYQSIYLPVATYSLEKKHRYLLVLCSTLSANAKTEDIGVFFRFHAMLEEKYSFRMVIFSESKEIQKLGQDYGIRVIPFLKFNEYKKPIFPYLMQTTEKLMDSFFYGYINGDVLLSESVFTFLETILANQQGHDLLNPGCLFAGRVSEVANMTEFDMSSQTASIDFDSFYHQGSLRNRFSSDYFIYPGLLFSNNPDLYDPVVLGRYYIDNWIMGTILLNHGYLVDATKAIHGIHMGTDTYWKKSIRKMISIKDFYYNKRITRSGYPWTSLVYANYTTYWRRSYLVLEKNV